MQHAAQEKRTRVADDAPIDLWSEEQLEDEFFVSRQIDRAGRIRIAYGAHGSFPLRSVARRATTREHSLTSSVSISRKLDEALEQNDKLRELLAEKYSPKHLLMICITVSFAMLSSLVAWLDFGITVVHPVLALLGLTGAVSFGLLATWRMRC